MATPQKKDDDKPLSVNPFSGFGAAAGGPLLFGGSTGTAFSFNPSTFGAASTKKDEKKDEGDEDDDEEGGDDDGGAAADESHAAEFTALVTLEKVDVKSGEDNEDVTFKGRSKLYVFVKEDTYGGEKRENWWRERGLGDVKILKDRTTGECRFLMRQEKTLKICANHKIAPITELKEQSGSSGKAYQFSAVDFADGEAKPLLFAIKFGQADLATQFCKAFEDAKKANQAILDSKGIKVASPVKAASAAPAATKPVAAPSAPAAATAPAPTNTTSAAKPVTVDAVAKEVSNLGFGGSASTGRVGGYGKCEESDPQVQAAVKFAVDKINKGSLVKLASVKAQVVAGMNYRMALHIKDPKGTIRAHVVTVYQPLPHTGMPLQLNDHQETGVVG